MSGGANTADVANIGAASAEGNGAPDGAVMGEDQPANMLNNNATVPEDWVERSRHNVLGSQDMESTTLSVQINTADKASIGIASAQDGGAPDGTFMERKYLPTR